MEALCDRVTVLERVIADNNGAHQHKSQITCTLDQLEDIEGAEDRVQHFEEDASKPGKKIEYAVVPWRLAENAIPDRTASAGTWQIPRIISIPVFRALLVSTVMNAKGILRDQNGFTRRQEWHKHSERVYPASRP